MIKIIKTTSVIIFYAGALYSLYLFIKNDTSVLKFEFLASIHTDTDLIFVVINNI